MLLHEPGVEGGPIRRRDQPLPGVDAETGDELHIEILHHCADVGVLRVGLDPTLPDILLDHIQNPGKHRTAVSGVEDYEDVDVPFPREPRTSTRRAVDLGHRL